MLNWGCLDLIIIHEPQEACGSSVSAETLPEINNQVLMVCFQVLNLRKCVLKLGSLQIIFRGLSFNVFSEKIMADG